MGRRVAVGAMALCGLLGCQDVARPGADEPAGTGTEGARQSFDPETSCHGFDGRYTVAFNAGMLGNRYDGGMTIVETDAGCTAHVYGEGSIGWDAPPSLVRISEGGLDLSPTASGFSVGDHYASIRHMRINLDEHGGLTQFATATVSVSELFDDVSVESEEEAQVEVLPDGSEFALRLQPVGLYPDVPRLPWTPVRVSPTRPAVGATLELDPEHPGEVGFDFQLSLSDGSVELDGAPAAAEVVYEVPGLIDGSPWSELADLPAPNWGVAEAVDVPECTGGCVRLVHPEGGGSQENCGRATSGFAMAVGSADDRVVALRALADDAAWLELEVVDRHGDRVTLTTGDETPEGWRASPTWAGRLAWSSSRVRTAPRAQTR